MFCGLQHEVSLDRGTFQLLEVPPTTKNYTKHNWLPRHMCQSMCDNSLNSYDAEGGGQLLWHIRCTCSLFNITMDQINSLQGFCLQLTARLNGEHRLECITLDCANEHVGSCRAEWNHLHLSKSSLGLWYDKWIHYCWTVVLKTK